MDLAIVARGAALGFTIAAAVGPISLLTIRRTLAHGLRHGLVSGLGVATADATYAAVAAFGLTAVTAVLVGVRLPLGVAGGLVIAWLGVRTIRSRQAEPAASPDAPGLGAAYLSILGLTLTNPMTILSFAAVFAAAGLATTGGAEAALLTVGVFGGSVGWWLVLTSVVARFRSRVTPARLALVNAASGVVLVAFGLIAVVVALTG